MNVDKALKLADSISRFVAEIKQANSPSDDVVIKGLPEWIIEDLENSATMLRRQQAELTQLRESKKEDVAEIYKLKAEIESLESGGEPVAWMFVLDGCRNVTLDEDASDETRHNGTPLYTHPAKTQKTQWDDSRADEIVSGLYGKFKEWSLRKFSADDVTWCEVKAEINRLIDLKAHPAKTLTDEEQFKDAYMANFLSAYMAVRYDNDCANGHPLKGYQPIEDAQFLANEAWAILRKASER